MQKRTYSNKELNRIINRAIELQQSPENDTPGPTEGHSLEDLIAVGRELGLGENEIRNAALEVETPGSSGVAAALLGGELVHTQHLILPFRISRQQAEELAADLSRIVTLPGTVSTAGRRVS